MGQRKLFYAMTSDNVVVHIDYVGKDNLKEVLLCPFCSERVTPRQGERNIWHFAHMGEPCSHSYDRLDPDIRKLIEGNEVLEKFIDEKRAFTVDQIEVPQDSKEFQCPLCFGIGNKEFGKKWRGNLYICNECFSNLNGEFSESLKIREM